MVDTVTLLPGRCARAWRNLWATALDVNRQFGTDELDEIEDAVRKAELGHSGEIRFAIESRLNPISVLFGQTARLRAVEVFSHLRVWDTEKNNGVLIYLLWSERNIEVIADRGLNSLVKTEEWEQVCRSIEHHLKESVPHRAVIEGVSEVGQILASHFADSDISGDELSNRPSIL